MKWAVLSDIHGNLEAFNAVLDCLYKEDIDRVAFLGDIVGYGANPNECIDLLKDIADILVAGNHDYGAVGLTDTSGFNSAARAAIEWTAKELSTINRNFLSGVHLISIRDDITFVHSTPYNPQNWDYLFYRDEVTMNFNSFQTRICFIGHSHVPAVFIRDDKGKVSSSKALIVRLEEEDRYIINVGSVGQPRDGIPDAAFGIYDAKECEFTLKRSSYDIGTAQKKIMKAGLPERLAARIAIGR
ncbi:MAG: metallophosphoesterase family protein [Thermodesulfobacteriota bacterium]